MMSPARMTPSITARLLRLKSQSRIEAARVPVQAPVPGRGMPTKSNKAQKIPLSPAAFSSFCPPLWPFSRHQLKKPPMMGLLAPQVSVRRAKKKIKGTGRRFPITPMKRAICNGKRNSSTQLNKWHHGDQEGKNVFHEVCLSICLLHSIVSCYN